MSEDDDGTNATAETAKATGEIAKTAGEVVVATREFGTFAARFIGGPLE